MTMTFDPDDTTIPVYDDRPIRIPRVVNPVAQKRGRNNRQNGARTERMLARMFERDGFIVYRQGGPNRRDIGVLRKHDGVRFSVESKHITGRPLRPGDVLKAWNQAVRQAEPEERPLVVVRLSNGTNRSEWLVVWLDGRETLNEWREREKPPL